MINYEQEVKKIHPDAVIQNIGYFNWHTKRSKGVNPEFIVTGYFVNIPTVWMPKAKNTEQAWQKAYGKLNNNTMTPLQKSIAEIEAKIAINKKQIEDAEGNKTTLLRLYSVQYGLQYAHNILTANLKYERGRIIEDFEQGEREGMNAMQGLPKDWKSASDYYTKTYEHEQKD